MFQEQTADAVKLTYIDTYSKLRSIVVVIYLGAISAQGGGGRCAVFAVAAECVCF